MPSGKTRYACRVGQAHCFVLFVYFTLFHPLFRVHIINWSARTAKVCPNLSAKRAAPNSSHACYSNLQVPSVGNQCRFSWARGRPNLGLMDSHPFNQADGNLQGGGIGAHEERFNWKTATLQGDLRFWITSDNAMPLALHNRPPKIRSENKT